MGGPGPMVASRPNASLPLGVAPLICIGNLQVQIGLSGPKNKAFGI